VKPTNIKRRKRLIYLGTTMSLAPLVIQVRAWKRRQIFNGLKQHAIIFWNSSMNYFNRLDNSCN